MKNMPMSEKQRKLVENFVSEIQKEKLTVAEAETMHLLLRLEIQRKIRTQKQNTLFSCQD